MTYKICPKCGFVHDPDKIKCECGMPLDNVDEVDSNEV